VKIEVTEVAVSFFVRPTGSDELNGAIFRGEKHFFEQPGS
jgi:hypothetical protein